jgi:hypothetical protein
MPTKTHYEPKPQYNTQVLPQRNRKKWLILGFFSLGILYYVYLLYTLQDLNKHWDYSHGPYEETTQIDLFTCAMLLFVLNFLVIPFIQYIRYERVRRHLLKAPPMRDLYLPPKGKRIFWLYMILNALFLGIGSMLFMGISSVVAAYYLQIDSTFLLVLFFVLAFLFSALFVWLAYVLNDFDSRWQKVVNKHFAWHQQLEKERKEAFSSVFSNTTTV